MEVKRERTRTRESRSSKHQQSGRISAGAGRQSKENKVNKKEHNETMQNKQVSQVHVKMTDGNSIVFDVRLSETVSELKRKIRSRRTCSDNDVCLTCR